MDTDTARTADAWAELRPFVRALALAMERKLRANDHKNDGVWDDPSWYLPARLAEETGELLMNPSLDEAADVANFAGMIAWRAQQGEIPSPSLRADEEAT